MVIAFTFTWLFNPEVGGTERVTDILAKELKKRGYTVIYIYSVKRPTDNDFDNPAYKTIYIPEEILTGPQGEAQYKQVLIDNNVDIVVNQGGVMGSCMTFVRTPDNCKCYTTIHFNPQYGLEGLFSNLARLRNNSLIEHLKRIYRIFDYRNRKHDLANYLRNLYTYWGENCNNVVLLSPRFSQTFKDICPNFPTEKISTIPNPLSFTVSTNIQPKEKIILWVGRMDFRQKRPDLMIKVWKKTYKHLPDWKVVMIGGGEEFRQVQKLAAGIPRLELLGAQPSKPWFEKAAIHCLTSSFEGWGMVLTEALSQGVVPIAFDSFESLHDILESPHQLVEPFDTKQYASKLIALAKDESLRTQLQTAGLAHAKSFEVETIVNQWETLFKAE